MNPTVMHTEDGYLVTFDEPDPIVFEFGDVSEKSHEIVCDVTVTRQSPTLESFTERLNILSASSKDGFRRSLDAMWDEGKGFWTHKLNQATAGVKAAHHNRDWAVDLSEVTAESSAEYLWRPLIPEDGHTIWFGAGESGKTYIALAALLTVAYGGDWMGYDGPPAPVLFVDYESGQKIIKRRLVRMADALGIELTPAFYQEMFHYWPGKGPLPTMLPALRRKVAQGVRLMVIDSAALAAGGSPQDEQVALSFFNAILRLGVPCVTLAHVTKAGEDQYPFGSIFWHTSARATWNVKSGDEMQIDHDGNKVKAIGFYQRKGNEDEHHGPVGFKALFSERMTEIKRGEVAGELSEHLSLKARIRKVLLKYGKVTMSVLATELGVKQNTIGKAIRSMPDVMSEGVIGSKDFRYFIVETSDVSYPVPPTFPPEEVGNLRDIGVSYVLPHGDRD